MPPQSSADIAKKYGGAAVADIAAQFGGKPVEEPSQEPPKPPRSSPAHPLGEFGTGIRKGVVNTAIGLSELVNKGASALGVTGRIDPKVFDAARADLATPESAGQSLGMAAEQIGEFFVPGGGPKNVFTNAPRIVRAVAGAIRPAAQTAVQTGGDPVATGVAGGLSMVVPGAATVTAAARRMGQSAEKSVVQALGPTKEAMKATAKSIAPDMLERGVSGSRESMLALSRQETAKAGQAINAAVADAAAAGKTVDGQGIASALRQAAQSLLTTDANGATVVVEGMQPVVRQLAKLEDFVLNMGPDIPIDKAQALKTAWDKIVAKAGLYGQKVGAAATDQAKAWAFREAASAFRKAIVTSDDTLAALNKEYQFWRGLKDVLVETEKRTQAHGSGLSNIVIQTGGGVAGFASGDNLTERLKNAALGAAGGKMIALLRSPYFKTSVSAPLKQRFADALASDGAVTLASAVKAIISSLPSQVANSLGGSDQ